MNFSDALIHTIVNGGRVALDSRDEWLEARRHGIGASDAAAVLGLSAWSSPLTLYCDKLGIVEPQPADLERMEWGHALEVPIAARYARETGRQVVDPGRWTIRVSAAHPFMLATLDREAVDPKKGPGVVEVKNWNGFQGGQWEDEPPLQYQVQLQHQLAVTGYQWGSLAVLIGGNRFYWTDVERNDKFIDALIEAESLFWDRVQRQDPPPPDASEACRDVLKRLWPKEAPGKIIALGADAAVWDDKRLIAKKQIDEWKDAEREADNWLISALGDAEAAILPDGTRYTYKQQPRKAYTVAATKFRVLRRTAAK